MSLLSLLAALSFGAAAIGAAALGLRLRDRSLLLLAVPAGLLGAVCAADPFSESGGLIIWAVVVAGLMSIIAVLLTARSSSESRSFSSKIEALEAEARAMAQEGSSQAEASRSRFQHLVEVTPLGVFEADAEGKVAFVSRRWQELTGLTLREAKRDGWLTAVHSEARAAVEQGWRAAVAAADSYEGEWPLGERGSVDWVHCQASPRSDPYTGATTYIGSLADISERKRLEEDRRRHEDMEAQAMKLQSLGVMAGGIAHDFNNLLVGVLGNAELLESRLDSDGEEGRIVGRLYRSARRAVELANQMLVFANSGVVEREPLELCSLVDEGLVVLSESERARVRLELCADLPTIRAERTRVLQIVTNLVRNALEASATNRGQVNVRVGLHTATAAELDGARNGEAIEPGEVLVLEVADEGCGITPEDLKRIFDPFFSTKFPGRGLGLGVVSGAVRANRAALMVDSTPGQGTRVRVFFEPDGVPEDVPEPDPSNSEEWSGQGTLLVVDDEQVVLETVQTMLERVGYQVLPVTNGAEAIELVSRDISRIDAVLLDMTMPGMSGLETLTELRRIATDLPVVVLSGHSEADMERAFADHTLAAFLGKPFRSSELLAVVRRALSGTGLSSRS